MRILLISFNFPYPPSDGLNSRDYNIIKQLSKYHDLFWINRTINNHIEEEYKREMMKYCNILNIIPWDYSHSMKAFLKHFFTGLPYIIHRFSSSEMDFIVKKAIDSYHFDLIFCDHIFLAQYLPENLEKSLPVIPSNEDNNFTYLKRLSELDGFIRPLFAKTQWKKMLNYEINTLTKYGIYITTSETEKKRMKKYIPDLNIGVIRNGIDLKYFYPMQRKEFDPNIVFVGWYRYYPNVDAVVYFVKNILPLVRKEIPEVKLYIIGKDITKEIRKLSKIKNVIIKGFVPDVRDYLSNADLMVVPLRVAAGTRNKILESMAMKIPVVATTLGAEGLEVKHRENILIADKDEDFAKNIIELIENKNLAKLIGEKSRLFVENNYDWDKIGIELNDFITRFVQDFQK